jgi:hypothetical protein
VVIYRPWTELLELRQASSSQRREAVKAAVAMVWLVKMFVELHKNT